MAILHRPPLPLVRLPFGLRGGRLMLVVAIAAALGIALFQVNQFSRLTRTSYELNDLNRQRAAKQAQNHEIEAEVARLSSLARVDLEARLRLGMEPARKKLYIAVNQPLPARESLPSRYQLPDAPQGSTAGSSWLSRVLELLSPF